MSNIEKKEFRCDHVKSPCCDEPVLFEINYDGHVLRAWCEGCGKYLFNGRSETLIALWLGDKEAVKLNKGYIPDWVGGK
jgi:hypothetical protein